MQLFDDPRGFSFQFEAALDMRFNPKQEITAADIVNNYSEVELAQLIRKYGENPTVLKSPAVSSSQDRSIRPRNWRPSSKMRLADVMAEFIRRPDFPGAAYCC